MRRENIQRNILFLCDDNAYLSQIAEASARHLSPPRTRIFSAGIKPGIISLRLVQAMQEVGISMRGQRTKSLGEVPIDEIDLIVSFCGAHKNAAICRGGSESKTGGFQSCGREERDRSPRWKPFAKSAMKSTSGSSPCSLTIGATSHNC